MQEVERQEAFELFVDLSTLVCCLEEMKDSMELNSDSHPNVQSFFFSVCDFPYTVRQAVETELLRYIKALSIKLQADM